MIIMCNKIFCSLGTLGLVINNGEGRLQNERMGFTTPIKSFSHTVGGGTKSFQVVLTQELEVLAKLKGAQTISIF